VAGAIIGGVAGNTITDGVGGIFEGRLAQKLEKADVHAHRTPFSTMMGKVIGCLIGAGIGLIIIAIVDAVFKIL